MDYVTCGTYIISWVLWKDRVKRIHLSPSTEKETEAEEIKKNMLRTDISWRWQTYKCKHRQLEPYA